MKPKQVFQKKSRFSKSGASNASPNLTMNRYHSVFLPCLVCLPLYTQARSLGESCRSGGWVQDETIHTVDTIRHYRGTIFLCMLHVVRAFVLEALASEPAPFLQSGVSLYRQRLLWYGDGALTGRVYHFGNRIFTAKMYSAEYPGVSKVAALQSISDIWRDRGVLLRETFFSRKNMCYKIVKSLYR